MDYRMYAGTVPANENVVNIIKNELYEKDKLMIKTPLKFIGFEGEAGTSFVLNNQKEKMRIPSTGSFITPYNGSNYCPVYSLTFDNEFSGNIYYII